MEATKSLIERAKQDAKERDREKRAAARDRQEEAQAEIEALAEVAAAIVGKRLDTEVTADQLRCVEDSFPDVDLIYSLTLDGMEFEVIRREGRSNFSLYLLSDGPDDPDAPLGPRRYIRRLADLVEE